MSYLVIACKSCGSPRVVDASNESAECPRCGTTTRVEQAKVHAETEDIEVARDALGQVNAQRAGGELVRGPEGPGPPSEAEEDTTPRDDIDRALVEAREVSSQRMKIRLTAEGLTRELETFTEEQWVEAMGRLDVAEPRAREHLKRLSRASVVAEPEHGTFHAIE